MFGYSYIWYYVTSEGYIILATYGASNNCVLLLYFKVTESKKWKGGKGVSRHKQREADCLSFSTYSAIVTYWLISLTAWYFPTLSEAK
jgi:hypothetical protein